MLLKILLKRDTIKYSDFKAIYLLIFFSLSLQVQAQNLTGTVQDTTGIALPYTNLIASPIEADEEITFAITDEKGRYKLNLVKEVLYKIEITHMGFSKLTDTLKINTSTTKDYQLKESTESLEDVIIKSEMAVVVKEDTITYRTDQFKTGDERKLRDILKKLPGVEVDREGNVKVNGKPVQKLMVDGKEFFFGDPKLGVNNIPADAVDEVEALDNYSEVAFLKGLKDSDKMALNIKLKEGKRKFAFGDIEVGGGHQDRYSVNPTLFYYSPKTSINFIGDFNNAGQKAFTFSDYMNFEGGFASMIDRPGAMANMRSSEFASFLMNQDFVFNQNDFGAGSVAQDLGNNWELNAYSIINRGVVETLTESEMVYQTGNIEDENRTQSSEQELLFSINKLKFRYDNINDTDLIGDLVVKHTDATSTSSLNSLTPTRETFVNATQQPQKFEVNSSLSLNKQFSYKHTTSINTNLRFAESENTNDWLFNQPIFSDIIPLQFEGDTFNLWQQTKTQAKTAQIDAKHYWVLHNFHHLYPVVGLGAFDVDYFSLDQQILEDGSINNFQEAGFNNDLNFRLLDAYFGFQYKTKIDQLSIRPGLIMHSFHWQVNQFNQQEVNQQKWVALPELMLKYEFNSSEKLNFDYNLRSTFGSPDRFANRLRLLSFNQLYQGNEALENELFHDFRLRYSRFNLFQGIFANASLSYTRREESIRNVTEIEGIDQVNTSIYTSLPENSYNLNTSITKRIRKLSFSLSGGIQLNDYQRIINNDTIAYNSNAYNYQLKAESRFKDLPNFEVGFKQNFTTLKSVQIDNDFVQTSPYININYRFLEDFIFKSDYTFNYYNNISQNQTNTFEIGNASLFYQKESSPWGFGVDVTNLFDVNFRNTNSVNEFVISDQRIFIQPRIIMFKLSYHF